MSRAQVFTFEEEARRSDYGSTLVNERFSSTAALSPRTKKKNLLLSLMQLLLILLYFIGGFIYLWKLNLADSVLGVVIIVNSALLFTVEMVCPPFILHYFRFWFEIPATRLYVFCLFSILVMDSSIIIGYISLLIVAVMAMICFFYQISLPPPLFSSSEMLLNHTFVLNPEYEAEDLFGKAIIPISIQQQSTF